MRKRTLYVLVAAGLFLTIFAMEQFQSTDPFSLVNFCKDVLEMMLLAGAVTMTAFVSGETHEIRLQRLVLLEDLTTARHESARWRQAARAHVAGLSQAITIQFRQWALTEAEADVASLLLKGLAHKEIAALRLCSEATVRQHATAVYRKSGLTSRSQLTAFFLEDLMMPSDQPQKFSVVPVAVG